MCGEMCCIRRYDEAKLSSLTRARGRARQGRGALLAGVVGGQGRQRSGGEEESGSGGSGTVVAQEDGGDDEDEEEETQTRGKEGMQVRDGDGDGDGQETARLK